MCPSGRPRYLRDVGEVEGGRRRKDVLEVLGARFLEAMERGVGIVLGQPLVIQAIPRQRHCLVLGQCYTDDLPVHLLTIQVAHCFRRGKENESQWVRMPRLVFIMVLPGRLKHTHR